MTSHTEFMAEVWTRDAANTVLRNVRRELTAAQVQIATRRQGRYSPVEDAKVALSTLETLTVAVEALAEIVGRKLNV